MNEDRTFRVKNAKYKNENGKQIDVFAADGETVLFVECKSTEGKRKSGSFTDDIHEIANIRW